VTNALARRGGEAIGRMRARVLAEAKTTFASGYEQTIGLRDVLRPKVLAVFARRSTGTRTSSTRRATVQSDAFARWRHGGRSCHA
jgi:hypothetical protein